MRKSTRGRDAANPADLVDEQYERIVTDRVVADALRRSRKPLLESQVAPIVLEMLTAEREQQAS